MGRWRSNGERGHHQTVHRDARRAVAWLDAQPEVRKVILGPYKPGRSGGGRHPGELAFRDECRAGLRFIAFTGDGLLTLVVLAAPADRDALLARVTAHWPVYAARVADPRRRAEAVAA